MERQEFGFVFPRPAGIAQLKCSQIVTIPRGFVCLLFTLYAHPYAFPKRITYSIILFLNERLPPQLCNRIAYACTVRPLFFLGLRLDNKIRL